ncbi:Nif3-like dinuclear metal center hexameric protein [Thalassotalea sp. LPB0316]|uniref:Nif3-like dinuclear metal center hexameric protein n=1 Tax=Thalassotalea sp. LPB0316 TaxID=2769490 RepID=UPI001867E4DD|nr:Nif3-like dinuclear metal center hexameric protein [Thalassotalea sp. LPB0316]QOL24579.1 Nif3-like dinuclear metal center hexameric protein [Thalassotalea sp. LPB0316]
MKTSALINYLDELLQASQIKDFCPNGLQVQGSEQINKIVTGVTASQALIDQAIEAQADALLVHHGYFWKNEPAPLTGMKFERIKKLIDNNINLIAYHLPLDIHGELGNNAQLAKLLNIEVTGPLEVGNPFSVAVQGELPEALSGEVFAQRINQALLRKALHISPPSNKTIKTVAWCTGGGQGYIDLAAQQGIDAFISGEVSEQTTHICHEMDMHFFAAGHHATERYGAKALGEHLAEKFDLDVQFIDINNPV